MRLWELLEDIRDQSEIKSFVQNVKARFGLADLNLYLTASGDLKLISIQVADGGRSKGSGSEAMRAICQYADERQARIVLTPSEADAEFGTTSRERLVQFYERFGFVVNQGTNRDPRANGFMYRRPRAL